MTELAFVALVICGFFILVHAISEQCTRAYAALIVLMTLWKLGAFDKGGGRIVPEGGVMAEILFWLIYFAIFGLLLLVAMAPFLFVAYLVSRPRPPINSRPAE